MDMELYSLGEMVIDFIPGNEPGSYIRNAGGAPANVAIAVVKNGLSVGFCGKVGEDDFGRFLQDKLREQDVEILCPERTKSAVTTMAFVSLSENGERSFTFARKPGADMFLKETDVKDEDIERTKIVHAGSCSLSKETVASATRRALRLGREMGKIVSFDINYRNLMWDDDINAATRAVQEIAPYIDFLKLSEEELEMVGSEKEIPAFMERNGITLTVETLGSKGAKCYFNGEIITAPSRTVKAVDATGAGDAFWGGFLSSMLIQGVLTPKDVTKEKIAKALEYGNIAGSICVQKKGAIDSLPTRGQIEAILKKEAGK